MRVVDWQEISKVMKEWYFALHTFKQYLKNDFLKDKQVDFIYNSSLSPFPILNCSPNRYTIWISTPNRKVYFDPYPEVETKISIIAHELLGHLSDYEQYYKGLEEGWKKYENDLKKFLSNEQRPNLFVMHGFPNFLYQDTLRIIELSLLLIGSKNDLREYEEGFVVMEMLGSAGMPRTDNIPQFFKEVKEETETPICKYLNNFYTFSLAGLAVPPQLNQIRKYGIRNYEELKEIQKKVMDYLKNKVKVPPKVITNVSNYKPEESIDVKIIKKKLIEDKILEELDKAISYWEKKFRRHNTFNYAKDLFGCLKRIYERIVN